MAVLVVSVSINFVTHPQSFKSYFFWIFFFFFFLTLTLNSGYINFMKPPPQVTPVTPEDENGSKKTVVEFPVKNRRVWTASFTLVNQWLDPGSPGGFRQTLLQVQCPKKMNVPSGSGLFVRWLFRATDVKIRTLFIVRSISVSRFK